jgi:hypothetical protein
MTNRYLSYSGFRFSPAMGYFVRWPRSHPSLVNWVMFSQKLLCLKLLMSDFFISCT